MRIVGVFLLIACVSTGLVSSVSAAALRSGENVVIPRTQQITEDLLAAGGSVSIEPDIPGDLTAAGGNVTVSGNIRDSAMLVGGTVTSSGRIGNDARIAGGTVTLSGPVSDNAYLAGGNVQTSRDANVGRDLLAAGGNVSISGNIGRNARLAGGKVAIAGTVNGDVYASTGEALQVLDGAVIRGNLTYESPAKAQIAPSARVLGEVRQIIPPREKPKPSGFAGRLLFSILGLMAAILFGALLLLLFPARTMAAADTVVSSILPSAGIGLLALIVVPIAALIISIFIITIPLSLAILFIFFVLLYAAKIFTALAVGRWILNRAGRTDVNPYLTMILGLFVFFILELIPIIGPLVWFLVLITGLGAFLISWWRGREARPVMQPEPQPV